MSTSGPRAVTKAVIAVPPAPSEMTNPAEQAEAFVQLVAAGGPKRCPACGTHYPVDFLVCPRDGASLQSDGPADVDALLGMVLGDTYKIHRMVGEGGMARVYEARHLRLPERRIAVKILHPEFARDTEVVQRFQREAESSSAINHPNVIDVFDVSRSADGRPYLVGEFLEGEELGEHLKKVGRLDVATAVAITRQICRALNAAHGRGIVHRDMKPENVFVVSRDGMPHIKVLDFGISKVGHRNTHLTRTGMIMGTPSFMAPEQARGEKVDSRADIYAVGALLYTLVTGHRPFDNEDPTATLSQVLTEEPIRPRQIEPSIPPALELVVQRAMQKDPRERYQTMIELDVALAPFDVGAPFSSPEMQTILRKGEGTVIATGKSHDPSARTMRAAIGSLPGSPAAGTGSLPAISSEALEAMEATSNAARYARPTIVSMSSALVVWFVFGVSGAISGTIRYFRPGDITSTESVLLIVGTALLAITPTALFALHVRRSVWPNSVRAVELASDLRRTAAAALVFYGLGSLLVRVLYTVFLRSSSELGNGVWDAGFFILSFLGALIAGGVGPVARFFRRKANG
ncbi:serine/threonine-protein kinase [Pendulispora albinea]|uniref:Serine/threonine protein kinase n=1 Tax=Pendulispora albinea TaxID=2741071 RepID=A0ABZ2M5W8_9BACT